jgi:hypothetical protein
MTWTFFLTRYAFSSHDHERGENWANASRGRQHANPCQNQNIIRLSILINMFVQYHIYVTYTSQSQFFLFLKEYRYQTIIDGKNTLQRSVTTGYSEIKTVIDFFSRIFYIKNLTHPFFSLPVLSIKNYFNWNSDSLHFNMDTIDCSVPVGMFFEWMISSIISSLKNALIARR